MINNRQAGRRRGRGGNGSGNGGNGGNGQRANGQRDTGNRIDNRARGNANQLYEKYKNLASDAQRQGDRVNTEYYLQFADHYFRVLSETRNRFDEQNQQRRQQNDGYEAQAFVGSFDTGFDNQDDEYGDEGEPIRQGEQAFAEDRDSRANGQNGQSNGAQNGQNGQNGQSNGPPNGQTSGQGGLRREGRPQRDGNRDGNRNDGNRNEGRRDEEGTERYQGNREANRDQAPRQQADRPQVDRQSSDRQPSDRQQPDRDQPQPRYEAPRSAADGDDPAPRRAPRAARRDEALPDAAQAIRQNEPAAAAPVTEITPEPEAPRRRGRPRRERPVEEAPAAFDAALLPPSIGVAPAVAPTAAPTATEAAPTEGEEKPRRRRVRATPTEAPPAS